VDDEEDLVEVVRYNLTKEGYRVLTAGNGEDALSQVRTSRPDLVILDLMLPGMDGLDVCRHLRSSPETAQIPVIMLTARTEEADVVTGLELGADDYITKPFSPRVLLSRVKAVLRRRRITADTSQSHTYGELTVHFEQHVVKVKGATVDLTATEFRILSLLARRPGWVFSREQIVDATQGSDSTVTNRSVDVHIVSLRRKLGSCGTYVETVRGVGYRFRDVTDA
jgi:two-component system alkaline phosphatase synthesis response regulator PhoP